MALASGTSRPLLGRPASTAWPHLAVSSSSPASLIRFPRGAGTGGGRAVVFLRAPAPPGDKFSDVVGSPYYVAPEVLQKCYGPEADVWSAGVILYILLCGVPPFWAETEAGIFRQILRGKLDFESEPWPSISDSAKDLVRNMLTRDPKKRFSAHEVLSLSMPLCQATHGLLTMPWHLISLLICCSVKVEAFFGNEQAQEDGIKAGDTVPYIICSQQDSDNTHYVGIAQRARHPEELKKDPDKWMIDIDYCLSQQIHPVVSRLCASIQGTSPARLAECLGLDSAKFQSRVTESSNQDTSTMLLSVIDDEDERYRGCAPLRLSCPSCSGTFDCPPVSSLITSSTSVSDPNDVLCKTLLDDVLCKTRLDVIYVLISM
ncbi:unnamed protein product [Miscanthus lutarioriparius]|uniref:DNA-directed DNA polymerase n=1 Tax=Miscanthus lutarioriparius TaxID=422564 RepID=A0A811QDH6_9POAL|nr:unnamed protein product [Miscanthus lutarioriparius]